MTKVFKHICCKSMTISLGLIKAILPLEYTEELNLDIKPLYFNLISVNMRYVTLCKQLNI